jgi:uncharacterized membrane protein (DUF4010 family)
MTLFDTSSLVYLVFAVALGAIVGLENEYRMQSGTKIYVGLRTCIFLSVLGYIFSLLYLFSNDTIILATAFGVITVIATSIYLEKSFLTRNPGATTYVSTFIIFFSGLLIGLGYYEYAVALSVLTAAISIYKREFLAVIRLVERKELMAAINIMLIALVILPLLPNEFIGPYSFFNPFEFWLIITIIGIVFFLQHVFLRASKYGLLFSAIVGSIITGTATAFSLLKLANGAGKRISAIFYNIMFSTNLPMIVVQAVLFIYLTTLSLQIIYYALPSIIISLLMVLIFLIFGRKNINLFIKKITNPFPIAAILEFATMFFIIFTASRIVTILAPQFLTLTMFVSGIANVAGAVFSLGFLFIHGDITAAYAGLLLGIIISSGLFSKVFVGLIAGPKNLKMRLITYSFIMGSITLLTSLLVYGI